jgi:hypothetical protein
LKAYSHRQFGKYLLRTLAPELPPLYRAAFLWGCVEPDYNYATYFRGFLRHERMRGHNYLNAERCMDRLCERLQPREVASVVAWYRLGKLVHYTADAFTHAHNARFGGTIREHRSYEMRLQAEFLPALDEVMSYPSCRDDNVMEMIRAEHERYLHQPIGPETDVQFVLRTAHMAFTGLTARLPNAICQPA